MAYALVGRVIDAVSDEAIPNGLVLVEGDLIVYAGPYEKEKIPPDARVVTFENATILPGYMDCHAHLCGTETAGDMSRRDDELLGAAYEVGLLLDAGFTGVRDMSRNGFALARAVERGYMRGPYIMPGGQVLGVTSGHVDPAQDEPKDYVNLHSGISRLCDGVADCVLAAREQFRYGAKFIKICATGGVSSISDDVDDVQFSPEEVRAIVEEARRHGAYVAAHCTGNAGAKQAIEQGVMCIEHGVMLEQETIDMMAVRDIPLITTLSVSLGVANIPGLHPAMARKAKLCAEANKRTIAMARKAGIRIAFGTDFSNSKNTPFRYMGKEFEAMTRAGLTPIEAIRAGTINAAYVMRRDKQVGSLEAGKRADIVMVAGDPLLDINVLVDAENVKLVMKNGAVEKQIQ